MKNLSQMLKQAQAVQQKMADMQAELETIEVEGEAGGGMVRVRLSAKGEMRALRLDPTLFKEEDPGLVEDLIIAAHNDAREKAQVRMQEEMARITGGLGLPEGFKLPF
ncbi:MAG: YbaB/EbfC family nucleoid-associated protein [Rhodothalassiaceae bacterium]